MRFAQYASTLAVAVLVAGSSACSDDAVGPAEETALAAITPPPGAIGVRPDADLSIRFSGPMAAAMAEFVDLHLGDVTGPVVPGTCAWSADLTLLTCTPSAPLQPGTFHTLHLGGGMMDAAGHEIEMEGPGEQMGGMPVTGTMMGGSHGGQPVGMMGSGWRHAGDGHLGMAFGFTTE
jgi:hypothetical protein